VAHWKRYTIQNVKSWRKLLALSGGELVEGDWPADKEIRAAGFDPEDHELGVCELAIDWKGHPAGARVLVATTQDGDSFAVEVDDSITIL